MASSTKFIKYRDFYLDAILNSNATKKLLIAGPGTGKTFTFKKILERIFASTHAKSLVITFIRNLAKDLKEELSEYADVRTFHSYCRSEIIRFMRREFVYYPNLLRVIEKDLSLINPEISVKEKHLEKAFYVLNEGKINEVLKIADYYNAGGHTDSVYRVFKYYEKYPDKIPRYPIVIVDEYQDFNLLEVKLVEKLAAKNPVLIVGDDDQALYYFKCSNPDYIRRLAHNKCYTRFELPYCSRCTEVIIKAVNKIIKEAGKIGKLKGRIEKPFSYFPPDKEKDSKENPNLVDVHCTVERKDCPYAAKFIVDEILKMPQEYKNEAIAKNEPAVLIIGPKHFLRTVIQYIKVVADKMSEKGWVIEEMKTEYVEENENWAKRSKIDAYLLLMKDINSDLGWRILLETFQFDRFEDIIKRSITRKEKIINLIKKRQFIRQHFQIANILRRLRVGQSPIGQEARILEKIGISIDELKHLLEKNNYEEEISDKEKKKPRIICTSFEGSKGLASQYVFILGLNNGYFPKDNPPTDLDICRLIVALTRARKRVYLMFYKNLWGKFQEESIFLSYIRDCLSKPIVVDKKYIKTLNL